MGSGYSKMKKQARQFEEQYEKMMEEAQSKRIEGSSGNGRVNVVVNGDKELKEVKISPECIDPNDVEGLQDLILAACQEAYKKAADQQPAGPSFPGGFSLPF